MDSKSTKRLSVAFAALLLAGCSSGPNTDPSTPDGSVNLTVESLKKNDVKTLVYHVVPEEGIKEAKASWAEMQKKPMSEQEKAMFNAQLAMLTSDKAEETVLAMAKPFLAQAQMGLEGGLAQAEGMAGMLTMNPALNETQQKNAQAGIKKAMAWAKGLKLDDEAKLKKAIHALVEGVDELGITSADDIPKWSFDEALGKAGIALGVVKEILTAYDFPIQETLDSIEVAVASEDDKKATLKVNYTFFGESFTDEMQMAKSGDSWAPAMTKEAP